MLHALRRRAVARYTSRDHHLIRESSDHLAPARLAPPSSQPAFRMSTTATEHTTQPTAAARWGTVIGSLGGLIGLGGAEFRLPVLIGIFRYAALEAVILNKAMSLVVVASALPFRARAVPLAVVASHWPVIVNLLAGSLLGAWLGASWATRLRSETLYRIISGLLLIIAVVLLLKHDDSGTSQPLLTGGAQVTAGVAAGLLIGVVASLLGVAGGEFLIPTLVMLFGADIKLAGSSAGCCSGSCPAEYSFRCSPRYWWCPRSRSGDTPVSIELSRSVCLPTSASAVNRRGR